MQIDNKNEVLQSFPTRRSSDLRPTCRQSWTRCKSKFRNCRHKWPHSGKSRSKLRLRRPPQAQLAPAFSDRKSTRLNSSHSSISYAVFCLKKKHKIRLNSRVLAL